MIPISNECYTRLHSSRMHTARFLTISPSMHCAGRGAWSLGVSGPTGGVCLVSQHAPRQTPCEQNSCRPPLGTEFLTHTTENITLPQTSFAGGKNTQLSSKELGRWSVIHNCMCFAQEKKLNMALQERNCLCKYGKFKIRNLKIRNTPRTPEMIKKQWIETSITWTRFIYSFFFKSVGSQPIWTGTSQKFHKKFQFYYFVTKFTAPGLSPEP